MWGSLASEYDHHSGNWIWSSPYATRLTDWAIFYGLQQSERGFTFEIITTFWLCWMEDAYQVEQDGQILDEVFGDNLGVINVSLNCIEVTYLFVPFIWISLFPNQKKEKKRKHKKCGVLFCFFSLNMNCFIYCTDSWFFSWTFISCQTV